MDTTLYLKEHSNRALPGDVVDADVSLCGLLVAGGAAPVAAAALQPTLDARVTEKVTAPAGVAFSSLISDLVKGLLLKNYSMVEFTCLDSAPQNYIAANNK